MHYYLFSNIIIIHKHIRDINLFNINDYQCIDNSKCIIQYFIN